ncbi:unnamed protein product [Durusdinium trenchii]|uniref:BTB domain-containing protein n=1 Tax=Durusdinium trenchii TaxID=1381693 RepID=A0ABP0KDM1_9DINO
MCQPVAMCRWSVVQWWVKSNLRFCTSVGILYVLERLFLTNSIKSKGGSAARADHQVRIENYSWNAVDAYGKYLHQDNLDAEPEVLLELLQLASEYKDETGLQSLCASVLRRKVTNDNLCTCFKKCMKFKFFGLAADVLKQGLNLTNACEALNIAGDAVRKAVDDSEKTMVEHIRDTVMAFAILHAKVVVEDAKFADLQPEIAKQLLQKLASMNLLKT